MATTTSAPLQRRGLLSQALQKVVYRSPAFKRAEVAVPKVVGLPERVERVPLLKRIKQGVLNTLANAPDWLAPCVPDLTDLELMEVDDSIRRDISIAMREHSHSRGTADCVTGAIASTFEHTGYDLTNLSLLRQANAGVKRTAAEWDAYFARLGIDPLKPTPRGPRNARVVPRFAAACALHIRTRLGVLEYNPANLLLVQRKYLQICREHGVRDVDIELHRQHVINTVFTDATLQEVSAVRRRLPAWVKWLSGIEEPAPMPNAVC